MKRLLLALIFVSALLFSFGSTFSQTIATSGRHSSSKVQLDRGWQFRQAGSTAWYPATVPGCVHTDLLANKMIGEPFFRDDEQRLQWIGKTNWEYRTTIDADAGLLARENIELDFKGLDTYADVFLNQKQILTADNMFREWRVDIKNALQAGPNTLEIIFHSPINRILPQMAKMKYQLPASNDQGEKTSPFTRKAPYQFGWDWGPRFVTSGVWQPVTLEAWDGQRIADLNIVQNSIATEIASLTAEVEIVSSGNSSASLVIDDLTTGTATTPKQVELKAGTNQVNVNLEIHNPKLWWPNGMGAHPLYKLRARLVSGTNKAESATVSIGLRTVELRRSTDKWGTSFEFVVNGVPVFAKGANWIPADSFPTRVTDEKYRTLVQSARDSNMNMLREWGGGIYENNRFYELCDEMGIMVWQEFMFACSMYPGDQAFLDNVRHEAIDNVKRLRNHPSVVMWCGNNEIETAYKNWGWKKDLPTSVWDDYKKIFNGVLPEVVTALDPSRPYWPSSPTANLPGDVDPQTAGDDHYWGVWHAAEPFTAYEKQLPRFMSEYGFQSFPMASTVDTFTYNEDRDIGSAVMRSHQRHPRGNQLIREYMLREFPQPKDFDSFLYISQVLQAEGIKIGAEHLRRIMPQNMGSLYWQIDDCWPVASWSSIDYYGEWKALQYYARRFYGNLLISPHIEGKDVKIYVVSDLQKPVQADIEISLMDFDGHVLKNVRQSTKIDPLKSSIYLNSPLEELLAGKDGSNVYLHTVLTMDGKKQSENDLFFQPFKNLTMKKPQINEVVAKINGGYRISLSTDALARDVYLSLPGIVGKFTDNFFNLTPGETFSVDFQTRNSMSVAAVREKLSVRSLTDAFAPVASVK